MPRPASPTVPRRPLACVIALALVLPSLARAQVLQSGDVVVPGNDAGRGVMFQVRGGTHTPLWPGSYSGPTDMMVDAEGRLVFMAGPVSRNVNDAALFRIDPATGALERLFYLPYIVQAGDTLPDGTGGIAGFYGFAQSLHAERLYTMTIDDTIQGGLPQFAAREAYGFSVGTAIGGQYQNRAYRYRTDTGRVEAGIDVSQVGTQGYGVAMASEGNSIYYGVNGAIGKASPEMQVRLHFGGGSSEVNALLRVSPDNQLVVNGDILDNTLVPNVTIQCGNVTDTDVPMEGGGFHPFVVGTIGVIGGRLYDTSTSVATGVPYMFDIARRDPFLNPYICIYYNSVTMSGPIPFWQPDGRAMTPYLTSPDGGNLLAFISGTGIADIGTSGGWTPVDTLLTSGMGRPVRWTGASVAQTAARAAGGSDAAMPARSTALEPDSGMTALVVRADTLVNVMLQDGQGHHVGFAADGTPVNELGPAAQVLALGASGWPHVIVITNPRVGNLYATIAGTASGAYAVTAYLGGSGAAGARATLTGTTSAGASEPRALGITDALSLEWSSGPVAVGEPDPASDAVGFVSVGPLPSTGTVHFSCRIPAGGPASLEIFDPAGRRVRRLSGPQDGARLWQAVWPGTDATGARVGPGVYLARLTAAGRSAVRRVVLTR